jgi:hypothetical protein
VSPKQYPDGTYLALHDCSLHRTRIVWPSFQSSNLFLAATNGKGETELWLWKHSVTAG